MDFKKSFEKYYEYESLGYFYEGEESVIRTDEEILVNQNLLSILPILEFADNAFDIRSVKELGYSHDESIDLTRLNWLREIQRIFEVEYNQYVNDEIYFYGCSFKVYEETYPKRLKEFQEKYIDASEIDFIKEEYVDVNVDDINAKNYYNELPVILSDKLYKSKKYSLKKQEEFLKSRMLELGYEVSYYDDESYSHYEGLTTRVEKYSINKKQEQNFESTNLKSKEVLNIDLSDSKGTEKVIMLYKLGVLDFLREQEPFKYSTNALASVISGITGEKQTVIQSYINPIYSKNVSQKNNPLTTEKTVNKVTQKLISIGYNQEN